MAAAHPNWWPWAWGREKTGPIRHDPFLTENLYDFEWRQVYERREDIDIIILWAWNSRMEQLYIEPDDGESGAAPVGDLLVRKTAWYARRFMSGASFNMFDSSAPWPLQGAEEEAKLKPRWDVHLSGDDEQPGCAGEFLSSVLGG